LRACARAHARTHIHTRTRTRTRTHTHTHTRTHTRTQTMYMPCTRTTLVHKPTCVSQYGLFGMECGLLWNA
jgi:carbohydrate-binding DOMON domain-containing protein